MTAGTRVAIYARVSTTIKGENGERKQHCETQLLALRDYCKQRGWQIVAEFVDDGVSGSKVSRPALNQLMDAARSADKKFDAVLVWKLDRFGRSMRHLVNSLAEFEQRSIAFVSITDNLDMTTASGRLMFHVISAMGEFERSLICERVKAGMRNAAAKGHLPGRKCPVIDITAVRERIAAGESIRTIAPTVGVSPSLLSKRLRESGATTTTN